MTDQGAQIATERFRRRIALSSRGEGCVVGWLEDDFHHFGVTIRHDERKVLDIATAVERFPWTTCPGAVEPLRALIGQRIVPRASDIGLLIPMREQCTHLFDLSGLLLAHASRGEPDHQFEAIVPMAALANTPGDNEPAQLLRDGLCVAEWQLREDVIINLDRPLGRGFREWTESMDCVDADHATILRRAITVAHGRINSPIATVANKRWDRPALCHSLNALKFPFATANSSSKRDFDASGTGMLAQQQRIP